jgi:hypothetical protein
VHRAVDFQATADAAAFLAAQTSGWQEYVVVPSGNVDRILGNLPQASV